MTTNQIFSLLHKRLSGTASAEEQRLLDDASTDARTGELREVWKHTGNYRANAAGPDADRAWARLKQRMEADGAKTPVMRVRKRRSFLRLVAAASVLLLAAAGTYWSFQAPTQWQTGPGEQLAVALPDGTTVQLNGASTLRLSDDFGDADRTVLLEGEGYFEVTKDAEGKKFTVIGDGSTVTVLGTAFNFRSYPDEKMCDVEVDEGKVRFACAEAEADLLLTAGKRARIMGRRDVLGLDGSPRNASAWRRGYLQFQDTPLNTALIDLSHFYGVEFDLDPSDFADCRLNGRFATSDRTALAEVLSRVLTLDVQEPAADRLTVAGRCNG